jgi:hypothetical protein
MRIINTLVLLAALVAIPFATAGPASAVEPAAYTTDSPAQEPALEFTSAGHALRFDEKSFIIAPAQHMLRVEFVGANRVEPLADGHAGAASFERVTYSTLWDGITLVYESSNDTIAKSTYYLDDGSRVDAIRLRYNRPVSLDGDGNLLVTFDNGSMVESAPIAWQTTPDGTLPVTASWALYSSNEVGFVVNDLVPGLPLVIDPWLTFLGGSNDDNGHAIALDDDGNVYVTGYSSASWGDGEGTVATNPVRAHATSTQDAFVAKLDSSGELQWNTFLGGSGTDDGSAVVVDDNGNVYVAGYSTASWGEDEGAGGTDPIRAYTSGNDAFVAKLNSNGVLLWNTFLGGSGNDDSGTAVALDGNGNVCVGGHSNDTWQGDSDPLLPYDSGYDAFAAKLNNGGELQWNTFLGGNDWDEGRGIAADANGNVYVAGMSRNSWGSPVRAYEDNYDAFAAKLDSGGALQWNTFLGGSSEDFGNAIAVGGGNVYVGGYSQGTWGGGEGVVTLNPVRAYAGSFDAFAAKLDSSGALQWNTFLGSSSDDYGDAIAVDTDGNVYTIGSSYATWQGDSEPVRPHDSEDDAFAAKLDSSGALKWNTFLGGSGADEAASIAVDDDGEAYVAGYCDAAWGEPVRAFTASYDAFAVKLNRDGSLQIDMSIDLVTGWNMVSVPLKLPEDGNTPADVFGGEIVAIYSWNPVGKSYGVPLTIEPELGYWVAVTEDKTITFTGMPVTEWESSLTTGWNMCGSVYGDPVLVTNLVDDPTPSIVRSAIYCWNPTGKCYDGATEIHEGMGHWVATTQNCSLTMCPPV